VTTQFGLVNPRPSWPSSPLPQAPEASVLRQGCSQK
jgi:hypothetical protein